jgi:hypothetical protein
VQRTLRAIGGTSQMIRVEPLGEEFCVNFLKDENTMDTAGTDAPRF